MAENENPAYVEAMKKAETFTSTRTGRKGKKIKVGAYQVPEAFAGKRLTMIGNEVWHYNMETTLDPVEKERRVKTRVKETKEKSASQVLINANVKKEIARLNKLLVNTKTEMQTKINKEEDVSALQETVGVLSVSLAEQRAKRKYVPKKYR